MSLWLELEQAGLGDSRPLAEVLDAIPWNADGLIAAIASGQQACMLELTAEALAAAGIPLAAHIHLDSAEQSRQANTGNWPQRLARLRSAGY